MLFVAPEFPANVTFLGSASSVTPRRMPTRTDFHVFAQGGMRVLHHTRETARASNEKGSELGAMTADTTL